jgi:predicted enzyme related to lactoylglutathione lyase
MSPSLPQLSVLCIAPLLLLGAGIRDQPTQDRAPSQAEAEDHDEQRAHEQAMTVQFLEIVTPSVDATCTALANAHGVTFTGPIAELGNARTANLTDGGRISVRAPMRDTESPVVRPYILVDDIEGAVEAATQAGATVAIPPMEIPGQGTFSIYLLGGIQHGLWQN